MTAATLDALHDLGEAAKSMQRLGSLTSGMWHALSGELVMAAEQLDRKSEEFLEDVHRRAYALEVAPDAVLAAGAAAGHLAEHRETLESLLPALEEEVRRLAAADVLLGFAVDDAVLVEGEELETGEFEPGDHMKEVEDEEGEEGDDVPGLAVDVWLFTWPAPVSPARVRIVPDITPATNPQQLDLSVRFGVTADRAVVDALSTTCGMPRESILPALSGLGLACWSAHQADEHGGDDDDAGDEEDDDPDE